MATEVIINVNVIVPWLSQRSKASVIVYITYTTALDSSHGIYGSYTFSRRRSHAMAIRYTEDKALLTLVTVRFLVCVAMKRTSQSEAYRERRSCLSRICWFLKQVETITFNFLVCCVHIQSACLYYRWCNLRKGTTSLDIEKFCDLYTCW